jgi:hypothetical protein
MPSARWARAASLFLLGALATWACSDSSSGGPAGTGGSSPSGGEAGAPAQAGRQSSAGEAGSGADPCLAEPDSEACREVPWCGPFQVTEVCGPTPFPLCPSSLANFIERTPCDTVTMLEVYDTTCGGKVLVRSFDARTESWEFDETDTLVSVRVEADSLHVCFEGGRSRSRLYGDEPCERDAASKVDVCAAQGGSGAGGAAGGGTGGVGGAGEIDVGGVGGAG